MRRKKEWVTFYLKKEHRSSITPLEKVITATCSEFFKIGEEKVKFVPIEMADLKPMVDLLGCPCYLDLTSKLGVLWLDGIERDEVEGDYLEDKILTFLQRANPHLELASDVLEVFQTHSSIVILSLGVDLYTTLLSSIGSREAQRELFNCLQIVFQGSRRHH